MVADDATDTVGEEDNVGREPLIANAVNGKVATIANKHWENVEWPITASSEEVGLLEEVGLIRRFHLLATDEAGGMFLVALWQQEMTGQMKNLSFSSVES